MKILLGNIELVQRHQILINIDLKEKLLMEMEKFSIRTKDYDVALRKIKYLQAIINKYNPFKGSFYIELFEFI